MRNRSFGWIVGIASLSNVVALAEDPTTAPVIAGPEIWKDASRSFAERAVDLAQRLTLEEKVSQLLANPPAITRLSIPAYSHRNECLHGVANGTATVFPQAIGMAATWDTDLIHQEADVIATEGRAKHNDYIAKHDGNTGEHNGLNFYSPNINIFRDPRWGRGQETYGEDPFLTGQIGSAFVEGLQGDDPAHPKAIACAKHFAVHSGPEADRHHFNATPSQRDLYDTYLPAFESLIKDAHAGSVMATYSALDGTPNCANHWLLTDLLRDEWKFSGLVFSDGGAIGDIWAEHHFVAGPVEAAAAAVKAGCDVSSGGMGQPPTSQGIAGRHTNDGIKGGWAFSVLPDAVKQGLISEDQITLAVRRELEMRFKLGLFDEQSSPYANIGVEQIDSVEHRALALKVAQESIVLLKNDGLLPLDRSKYKRILIAGPNAEAVGMQNGNYAGRASRTTTIVAGIKAAAGDGVEIIHVKGCPCAVREDGSNAPTAEALQTAVAQAKACDLVIFASGIDSTLEQEESGPNHPKFIGFNRGDRSRIELPAHQIDWIKALSQTGRPLAVVNCSGSPMALPWVADHVPAIVQAWYPGEEGGAAVAQVLFGDVNPSGKLPVSFYAATEDLPPFDDYSMAHRTYRYFRGKPAFPFGHGLSFTQFDYRKVIAEWAGTGESNAIQLRFTLQNTGAKAGSETAQIYAVTPQHEKSGEAMALIAFDRVSLAANESQVISIKIPVSRLARWNEDEKKRRVERGHYELLIGSSAGDIRQRVGIDVQG